MSTNEQALPLLPEPDHSNWSTGERIRYYTADQMRAYARAALTAEQPQSDVQRDAERLDWLDGAIFMSRWNGVIGAGSKRNWTIAANWRHTVYDMVGSDFRSAIDTAMAKERT